jgi:hypothetical protein
MGYREFFSTSKMTVLSQPIAHCFSPVGGGWSKSKVHKSVGGVEKFALHSALCRTVRIGQVLIYAG